MPITVQPLNPSNPALPSYLTVADAEAVAAQLTGLAAWAAASSQAKADALGEATSRVETSGPYQGRRYDAGQALEFPRVPFPAFAIDSGDHLRPGGGSPASPSSVIWDWDAATKTVVVPLYVRRAVVVEADVILAGDVFRVRAESRTGLASQSIGGASESYAQGGGAGGAGGVGGGLCPRATALVDRYTIRTGQLL